MRCVAMGSSAEAGSSISRISGWIASARAMQSRCCWPPDNASADSCSRSLTSSQRAADLRLSSTRPVQRGLRACQAVDAQAVGDVLEDRFGKRVGFLEHHADAPPQLHDVAAGAVDVAAVDEDLAFDARPGNDVVHPVQRAQERALPAAGRPDERGDEVRLDADRDVLERPLRAVVEIQIANVDDRRPSGLRRLRTCRPVGTGRGGSAWTKRHGPYTGYQTWRFRPSFWQVNSV